MAGKYLRGEQVAKNLETGKELLKKSADAGYGGAHYTLAVEHLLGKHFGFQKDVAKSIEHLKIAVEKGHLGAHELLGLAYIEGPKGGLGQKKDLEKGQDLLEHAADQGYASAQVYLGNYYLRGVLEGQEGKPDYDKALHWAEKAVEQDNSKGKILLAKMYFGGKGVKRDKQKAIKLFASATKGAGQSTLGDIQRELVMALAPLPDWESKQLMQDFISETGLLKKLR